MHTPYRPPKSRVSDPPEPQQLLPKPLQVRVAVGLLWLSIALALPSMYLEVVRAESPAVGVVVVVLMSVVLAFAAFLNVQISRGRNWARITLLVLLVISWVVSFIPDETRAVSTVESAMSVISAVVDVAAIYLLFTSPGALWFRSRT